MIVAVVAVASSTTHAFQTRPIAIQVSNFPTISAANSPLFSTATGNQDVTASDVSKTSRIRREGGPLSFATKYGALNPYAIYYGLLAIFLGIPWFIALKAYALLRFLTRNKFDKLQRIPTTFNHLWGVCVLVMTRSFPRIENLDILRNFYKE